MTEDFFIFINTRDRKLLAVAQDRGGTKLPQNQGRWQYWKEFQSSLSGRAAFGLTNAEEAYASLKERGYYLWRWPTHIQAA
jgi:hypothetical protein